MKRSTTKETTPPEIRSPGERRAGESCPSPPVSTSSVGSGAGARTRPSLKPAIVSIEKLQMDVSALRSRPGKASELSSPSTPEQYEEALSETPAAKPSRTMTRSINARNTEVEFVSAFQAVESARPRTLLDGNLEIVSMEIGTGARRGSTSSSSGKIRPPQRVGQKRKKVLTSPETEEESPRTNLSDTQRKELDQRLQDMERLSSSDMAARAMELLEDTEECRRMSNNIKGSITRKMKLNVAAVAEITKILSMRASQEGDVGFLRARFADMQSEINGLREENQRLKLQMEEIQSGLNIRASPTGNRDLGRGSPTARMEVSPDPPLGLEISRSREASARPQPERKARATRSGGATKPSPVKQTGILEEEFLDRLGTIISGAVANALWTQLPGRRVDGERKHVRPRDPPDEEGGGSSVANADSQAAETDDNRPPLQKRLTRSQKRRERRTRAGRAEDLIRGVAEEVNRPRYIEDFPPLPVAEREDARPRLVREGVRPNQRGEREYEEAARTQMNRRAAGAPRRGAPRSSAITISRPEDGMTYFEIIRKARDEITLEELGIEETRTRSTVAGNVLIEIPGENTSPAADNLARKLREAFRDTNVQIRRPTLRGELRLAGLDASVTTEKLIETLAKEGNCDEASVRLGSFRLARNGLKTVWLQCPLDTANKLAEAGRLRVGWSTALVVLLKRRPMQCFRCFATGHVRDRCPSNVDRTDRCFNCGEAGYTMRECGKPSCCPICKDKGLNHNHRAGSEVCLPCPPRKDLRNSPRRSETLANRSNAAEERTAK
ncbi:PREDICTED: uncharacterized protein LOC105448624 [Wasmannia auropunctata]|uniref:uncharacterized protein LOC105448624 n=1 Tax=Wasmannia auropunctata TaxID=64793 RepID=UPI0005EF055B|nr:PREDICTED: uncharacterized protein LOC105448624 [Wasmannia auropunctata]